MPVRAPEVMRKAWGEEVVGAFIPWLDTLLEERVVLRDEYREVLSRLDGLEKDISLVKESLTQTRAEFREEQAQTRAEFREEQVQTRAEFREDLAQARAEFREDLSALRMEMNQGFGRVNEQFDRVNERFDRMSECMLVQTRWLVGSIVVFGLIVSTLMAIAQFTP